MAQIHHLSDYRAKRRDAYPDVRDQLDALWKGGAAAEAMAARIREVKAKFPKLAAALPRDPGSVE